MAGISEETWLRGAGGVLCIHKLVGFLNGHKVAQNSSQPFILCVFARSPTSLPSSAAFAVPSCRSAVRLRGDRIGTWDPGPLPNPRRFLVVEPPGRPDHTSFGGERPVLVSTSVFLKTSFCSFALILVDFVSSLSFTRPLCLGLDLRLLERHA